MSPGSQNPAGGAKASIDAPPPGTIIAGKYEVEKLIGAGGMGMVVSARHLQLNKRVAVKLLHPRAAAQTSPAARFRREARAAASLRSEHVATIMDFDLESGAPYMVMEFLSGSSLSKVIRQRAPMAIDEAVDYTLQACEAISEAHGLGIWHRDLKPGNLFLTKRPDGSPLVKVLDFGISKMVGQEPDEQDLTATNMILGSPQYASPEQLRGLKNVDSRTDIWALGVILYYMLSGRRPFEAETLSALFVAISTDAPPALGSLRPGLPASLEAIVMQCLEKNREQRVQSVQILMQGLRPFGPSSHHRGGGSAELVPVAQQGRDAASPTAGQDAAPPMAGQDAALPMAGRDAALPMAGQDAALAMVGRDLILSPSDPITGPSAQPRGLPIGVEIRAAGSAEGMTAGARRVWDGAPAPQRGTPMWVVQIAVAVGAVALVVILYVKYAPQSKLQEASQVEGVQEMNSPTPTAESRPPTPSTVPAPAGSGDPIADYPLDVPPPVGIAPVAKTAERPPLPPGVGGAGQMGISRAKIKLMNRAGGGAVVGELAAGEVVMITQRYGDWLQISHIATGLPITGWTPKATIKTQ
jgi:serine/threonine-protein kinase